jgi:hypothetical protein
MRIRLCSCLIIVALGLSPVVALGDPQSHRKAAENLLMVMEVDKSLPKVVAQASLDAQHGGMVVLRANAVPALYTGDRRRRISG